MASLKNVAIVGAGGNSGTYMVEELLKTGKHAVTAITRADSTTKLPEGITVKQIDYEKPETIVEALKGQDVLIITMSVFAPREQQGKLVDAAVEAGVPWVFPNHWSPDTEDESLAKDVVNFGGVRAFYKGLEKKGKINFICLATGFWYEWSLAIKDSYGFDFINRKATFYDDGKTKISTTTWPQVGKAIAALLSLPVKSEGSGKSLEEFKNKVVYVNSFTVSQQDMFESVLRVTGDKKEDWSIEQESAVERYTGGVKAMKEGNRAGFVKMMYTRVFYQDGNGDYESRRGTLNKELGLPKENLDEATKAAIERAKEFSGGYGH